VKEYKYILVHGATSETLTINPAGWDDLGITLERSEVYHSILRDYSLSLRFARVTGGGGEFIKEVYEDHGINSIINIWIYERNTQTNDYDIFYNGILDFSPDRFYIERDFFEIAIIDGSKEQKFKTRDEINYDLNSTISHDNIAVDHFDHSPKSIKFKKIDIQMLVEETGNMTWIYDGDNMLAPWPPYNLDTRYIYYYATTVSVNEIGDRLQTEAGPYQEDRTIEIYENKTGFPVNIEFTDIDILQDTSFCHFYHTHDGQVRLRVYMALQIVDSDDVVYSNLMIQDHTFEHHFTETGSALDEFNWDLSALQNNDIYVPDGYRMLLFICIDPDETYWSLYVEGRINSGPGYTGVFNFNLSFIEKSLGEPDTQVNCFFPHEAFTRLIQLMTSETDQNKLFYARPFGRTDSEFVAYPPSLSGLGSRLAITNGFNLRGFPNKPFNVNIKDLFKTFDSILNLGLGYDRLLDRFYIAQKSDFYKADYLMFDIGEVKELVIKPYKNGYYNNILSGFDCDGQYEKFQGAHEFNVQTEHSISLLVKNQIDLRAPHFLDSVGIELTRRKQYITHASEDTKYDDNIIIVRTNGSETIQGGTNESGFVGIEEYYNLELTPRENLIRWSNILRIGMWKDAVSIKFVSSKKKINITYLNQNGDIVNEFDDLDEGDLPDIRLFDPEILEFSGIIDAEKLAILDTDPHGFIRFSFNGESYDGYINKLTTQKYNRTAKYELLSRPYDGGRNKIFEDGNNFVFEDGHNYIYE
jgi:hypothetical protein